MLQGIYKMEQLDVYTDREVNLLLSLLKKKMMGKATAGPSHLIFSLYQTHRNPPQTRSALALSIWWRGTDKGCGEFTSIWSSLNCLMETTEVGRIWRWNDVKDERRDHNVLLSFFFTILDTFSLMISAVYISSLIFDRFLLVLLWLN